MKNSNQNKMKKITAVEWLITEINKLTGLSIQMDEPIIEKALEMEKEQLIDAYQANAWGEPEGAEEYYKQNTSHE